MTLANNGAAHLMKKSMMVSFRNSVSSSLLRSLATISTESAPPSGGYSAFRPCRQVPRHKLGWSAESAVSLVWCHFQSRMF